MSSNRDSYSAGYWTPSSSSWSTAGSTSSYSSSSSSHRSRTSSGSLGETKSRLNHKNQVVCVTNYGQSSGDKNEPRPEYRDASRYYSRGA
ncbi:hypothetical protein Sste5346_006797 [Sporothrix stenoceras]|uniref:Uncharacterized protein n=1 Tax=Sporothrix stenoceras TaxID=5173 RepID=A0ABR3YY56_9PEZI